MQQQYKFVCLLLFFISGYQTQEITTETTPIPTTTTLPDWYGDPSICTINQPTTPSPGPAPQLPKFTNQAEFTLELVVKRHRLNSADSNELSLYHYLYDYDNNILTLIELKNEDMDIQFYEYDILKRSTYSRNTCAATSIATNNDIDGRSATLSENGTWHIRPMNEFLLFSSDVPGREIVPVYLGPSEVRGIPVDQWSVCHVNRALFLTEKRIWSFAQEGIPMPSGIVGELGVPVQAIINGSLVFQNNTQRYEFDEVFNILSYQPSLLQSTNQLAPPRGVFCDNVPSQELVSLSDAGIRWPFRFNVRIEASTSRSAEWQRFHLYYHRGDNELSSRLRYDYLPQGAEDYQSVIHDYTDNLTYIIDRRLGTCQINRGVEIPDVNPLVDPIRFFIKNEASFMFTPPENAWEKKGFRLCRTGSIECTVLTTTLDNFPPIVESDTGEPSGDTWKYSNIEYAWAVRSTNTRSFPNASKQLDYPVSLLLKMYRDADPNNPSPLNLDTADVEYEFYEMSHDSNLNRFDTSTCYRSLNYEYLHLTFILKPSRGNVIDGNQLNRRRFDDDIHYHLINRMQIRYSRITDLEIDHESSSDDVVVFFTILGQTPNPESASGFYDDEPTAAAASDIIEQVINDGQFEFEMRLQDGSDVQFQAKTGSLKTSKQYMSTHASGQKAINGSYSSGSLALAIVVGSLAGLLVGIVIAAIIRIVKKKPMPSLPSSVANPLPTINFRSKTITEATSEA